jgi:hypothetical protein
VSGNLSERHPLTFRPRSYMAFAITPKAPIIEWLAELDASLEHSEKFSAAIQSRSTYPL